MVKNRYWSIIDNFQDLARLGRDLHKVLIIDNSPASYSFHPENAVSGFSINVPK